MRRVLLTFAPLICLTGVPVFAQICSDLQPGSSAAVVEIGNVKLSLADVERKRPAMFQARAGFYEAQKKAIEDYVDEHLLEQQAKKENLTVPQLLDKYVNSKVNKDFTEDSLRVYYEGLDTTETYEAVRDKIVEHLRQKRMNKAKAAYVQTLRKQMNVAIRISPPRADVSLKGMPVRGRADAKVVLVEFADYECPYCQQAQPALDKLLSEYKDRVAYVYKDTPLPMHQNAKKASEAAHCAGEQGKYWEFHDLLAQSSKNLEVPKLKERARQLKLNGEAFDKCLDSGEKAKLVETHLAEAQSLGLQGTPTFFINGRFYSGVMTYEKLKEIVDEELGAGSTVARNSVR